MQALFQQTVREKKADSESTYELVLPTGAFGMGGFGNGVVRPKPGEDVTALVSECQVDAPIMAKETLEADCGRNEQELFSSDGFEIGVVEVAEDSSEPQRNERNGTLGREIVTSFEKGLHTGDSGPGVPLYAESGSQIASRGYAMPDCQHTTEVDRCGEQSGFGSDDPAVLSKRGEGVFLHL